MAALEQEFQKCAKEVSDLKTRPNDQELLSLYGLYKQATVGDCDQPKPGMFALKERAKHEAWSSKKGISKEEAMKAYIALCKELTAQYNK